MDDSVPGHHGRFDYSAIVDRPPLRWPNGKRIAVWVIPNIEHYPFDKPGVPIAPMNVQPDVLNYSWRDYGSRVGVWRMIEVMEKHGVKGTAALNSEVCSLFPRIIEAGSSVGWEWMGHAPNNTMMLSGIGETDEREIIRTTLDTIASSTGTRPRGWLGAGLTETTRTPDMLAEAGIDYVADWVNDEQPYPMKVKSGRLLSVPYSIEINDLPFFILQKQPAEAFGRAIRDQFDQLYIDSATSARVMAIALHPFVIGHPFRSKYLDEGLAHIAAHDDVWFATGSEIADAYLSATATGQE